MGKLVNYVSSLHKSTSRSYIERMNDNKIECMIEAKKYGKVVVGLLSDQAIAEYKDLPILNYEERYKIAKSIKNVDSIVKQNSWDFSEVINQLKPDFLVHGDDWKTGVQKETRQKVIEALDEWGGKLIEPNYTKGISSTKLISSVKEKIINLTSQYPVYSADKKAVA